MLWAIPPNPKRVFSASFCGSLRLCERSVPFPRPKALPIQRCNFAGLIDLVNVIRREKIKSIAIPPLGCGNGGLNWTEVRPRILQALAPLSDVQILLYVPTPPVPSA